MDIFNNKEVVTQLTVYLREGRTDLFMDLTYRKLTEDPEFVYTDDGLSLDYKIEQINNCIQYFTKLERFEECVILKRIISDVNEYKKNKEINNKTSG